PELPMKNRRAYGIYLHFKNLLHGLFDLGLGGAYSHFKDDGALRLFDAQAFFRDDRPANHFVNVDIHAPTLLYSFSLLLTLGLAFDLPFARAGDLALL